MNIQKHKSNFFFNKYILNYFIFTVVTFLVFFSWFYELINFQNLLSPQLVDYFLESLSIALTEIKYGFNGYIGKTDIFEQLRSNNIEIIDKKINEILKKDNYSNNYHLLSVSEIGYVDYIKISFYIFGFQIKSLVNLHYSILFISYLCFFFSYIEDKKKLFAGISLLVIILLFNNLIIPNNNSELYFSPSNLFNFRYLSVLAIIPALHLFFFNNNIKKNLIVIASFIIQVIIILFLVRIRFLIIWIPIGLMLLTLTYYIFYKQERKNKIIKLIIFFLIVIKISLISITDDKLKNQLYFEKSNFAYHSPAFSSLIGLLTNNDLRIKYSKIDRLKNKNSLLHKYNPNRSFKTYDQDGYGAAFYWLKKNGYSQYKLFNFKENENVNYQKYFDYKFDNNNEIDNQGREFIINKDFNFELMEKINKKVLLEVFKNDYLFVFRNFLFEKPFLIFLNSFKTYGLKISNYIKIFIVLIFLFLLKNLILIFENNKKIHLNPVVLIFLTSITLPNLLTNVHSQVVHDVSIVTVWYLFLFFLNRINLK